MGFVGSFGFSETRMGRRRVREVFCKSVEGVAYRSGKKLVLEEVGGNLASAKKGYLRCEVCTTCYLVNLPFPKGVLKCSECGNEWDASSSVALRIKEQRDVQTVKGLPERSKARERKASKGGKHVVGEQLNCSHFAKCSGCSIESKFAATPALNSAQKFAMDKLRLKTVPTVIGDIDGWRTTARLAVRKAGRKLAFGLYEKGTHNVVEIPKCVVHYPQVNNVLAAIKEAAERMRVEPYDERTRSGMLRYVHLLVERTTGLVSVTLVWNASTVKQSNPGAGRVVKELWTRRLELKLHSIWLNLNVSSGNTVLAAEPNRWKLIRGERMLKETLLDATVFFLPSAFRQANLSAFERLLESLVKFVPDDSRVVEFCAGVGAIGLAIASRTKLKSLLCTELNKLSEDAFQQSWAKLPSDVAQVTSFEVGTAAALRERLLDCDIAIADPPRQGLDFQFLELLCAPGKSNPSRFIYVSCGQEAFQKDAERLLRGGWTAVHAEAHLFFPGSNHVEMLAVFDRSPSRNVGGYAKNKTTQSY